MEQNAVHPSASDQSVEVLGKAAAGERFPWLTVYAPMIKLETVCVINQFDNSFLELRRLVEPEPMSARQRLTGPFAKTSRWIEIHLVSANGQKIATVSDTYYVPERKRRLLNFILPRISRYNENIRETFLRAGVDAAASVAYVVLIDYRKDDTTYDPDQDENVEKYAAHIYCLPENFGVMLHEEITTAC